jgi:non-heme chloroperoxidase
MGPEQMFRRSHVKNRMPWRIALTALSASALHAQDKTDSSPHTVQLVPVEQDVKLEVLDWGGTGRPLVFLAGLGNNAHVFDSFAPKFTANHHVYGITRRGFGASSKPAPANGNYASDRLGDDVLAVMDALKLDRPVLAGHSLAGEELSSIGSRYPEKVTGLIYLDAGYGYAYYDRAHGELIFDMFDLKKRLDALQSGAVEDQRQFMRDMLISVSQFEKDLQESKQRMASVPELHPPPSPPPPIIMAINLGGRKYTEIRVPILAIFACPHNFDFDPALRNDSTAKAAIVANDLVVTSRQADAFTAGIPSAHVVRLANADHYVFRSNQADVLREMNTFLAKLP